MHSQIIRKQGQSEGQVGHLEIWWQGFNLGPEMPCDMLAVTQLMITGGKGAGHCLFPTSALSIFSWSLCFYLRTSRTKCGHVVTLDLRVQAVITSHTG